jgi:secondary thiamine-phosphate synthase enzyme
MSIAVEDAAPTSPGVHGRHRSDAPPGPAILHLPTSTGRMLVSRSILRYETEQSGQFLDITADAERVIAGSGVTDGSVTVFSKHTTAAIKISEHEPELLKDLQRTLAAVAPEGRGYFHNDFSIRTVNMVEDECPNGQAHCQHLVLAASETVPVIGARLMLGRWQRIFLIELDHGRTRDVVVTVMGC